MDKVRPCNGREGGLGRAQCTSPGMDEVDNVWSKLSRVMQEQLQRTPKPKPVSNKSFKNLDSGSGLLHAGHVFSNRRNNDQP